jgi:S1-C subfamily serine protease
MTLQLGCPSCRHPLILREEYLGQQVQCPSCRHIFEVASPAKATFSATNPAARPASDGIVDRKGKAAVFTSEKRRGNSEPRRSREPQPSPSNAALWWLVGGGFGGISLILVIAIVVLLVKDRPASSEVVHEPPAPIEAVVPAQGPEAPAIDPAPPTVPEGPMTGEQIYQRLLKSTVFIVALTPAPPQATTPARPPFPKLPPMKTSPAVAGLLKSIWQGNEDLPGFGRLRFEFFSATEVTMIDAKQTSVGRWHVLGNTIKLDFQGANYTGTMNDNTMSGTAKNADGNKWNWAVNRQPGSASGPPARVAVRVGTGVLIDAPQRLVVTNVHVVGSAENVDLVFPRNDDKGELLTNIEQYKDVRIQGRVVFREPRADLALVQLEYLPRGVLPLPIASQKARPAQQVHSVGNPGASKAMWIYSPGKVRQVYKDKWEIGDRDTKEISKYDAVKLETDSAINPGDSGGPLVNDRCALVGIAHASNILANNMSYFIEVSEVRDVVGRYYQSLGKKWQPLTD